MIELIPVAVLQNEDDAGQHERDDVLPAQERVFDSLARRDLCGSAGSQLHFLQLEFGLLGRAGAKKSREGGLLFSARERASVETRPPCKLPITNKMPGGNETQKMRRQACP